MVYGQYCSIVRFLFLMLLTHLLRQQTIWIEHHELQVDDFLLRYVVLVVANASSLLLEMLLADPSRGCLSLLCCAFEHFDIGANMKCWS